MSTLDNVITYVGSAVIIYLLIKAFGGECMGNINSIILVVGIMGIVIFLVRKGKKETFTPTGGYSRSGFIRDDGFKVIPRPTEEAFFRSSGKNGTVIEGKFRPYQAAKFNYGTTDKDLIDQMNISGVDKQKFEEMMVSENNAKADIKSRYQAEMAYTDSNPFNTVPLGRPLNAYTYLPEYAWFRGYEKPPVCIPSGKECPVCPLSDNGTSDLMHFSNVDSYAGRAPEGINLEYTANVLNQGIN